MSSTRSPERVRDELAATGVPGLDEVLGGGLARTFLYLIEGVPGSGKTTLAFQFLLEGARRGEASLYLNFSESAEEVSSVVSSHGWSLDEIAVATLTHVSENVTSDQKYAMFHSSEVELSETTRAIRCSV